jgi:putative peptide zinc metalloprotease protein
VTDWSTHAEEDSALTMAPQHPDAPPGERSDPWHARTGRRGHRHPHPHPHQHNSSAARRDAGNRPALADGVTLLGEFEGSGYVSPHYLARKANESVVQLSELLFLVADACDGRRNLDQIAAQVTERCDKAVSADNVATLLEKLRPLGVVTAADGSSPEAEKSDPLLALKFRTSLVSENGTRLLTLPFRPLFFMPLVLAVIGALVAFDVWLFFVHGLAQGVRAALNAPTTMLLVAALVVLSAAFHEIGHATACVVGGGRPGRMGAGVYLAWPAFYTDVTDAYRLDRKGRLRTDLGGIYFNAIFVLALGLAWQLTHFEPLLLIAFLLQIEIVHQMLPFLRLDGYYVLSDIAGVPDLFRRIGPVLKSALPGRKTDESVNELKRWVRVMVTVWVLVVVPLLLFNLSMIVLNAPRILATAWDAGAKLVYQLGRDAPLGQVADVLQLLFLSVPIVGLVLSFALMGRRAAGGAWSWSAGRAPRRALVLAAGLLLLGLLAVAWWPDARMSPYRPGEKGTLIQAAQSIDVVGRGRPELRSPQQAATQPLSPVAPNGSGTTTPVAPPAPRTGTGGSSSSSTASPGPAPGATTAPTSTPLPATPASTPVPTTSP